MLKHVPDETWATVVADMYRREYPEMDFEALEQTALKVVAALRQGRRHMPGGGIGMLMKETFEKLADNGMIPPFRKDDDEHRQAE